MVAEKEFSMRRFCNVVVGVVDIFEVQSSIELQTIVEGYLEVYGIVVTHGYDQSV